MFFLIGNLLFQSRLTPVTFLMNAGMFLELSQVASVLGKPYHSTKYLSLFRLRIDCKTKTLS